MSDKPPPTKKSLVPLREVQSMSDVFENTEFLRRLEQACFKTPVSSDRMLRSLIGSVQKSPDLMKCGILDVASKMLICAQAGLEVDTPLGHAHLVPFQQTYWENRVEKTRMTCQVIFGYHGLLDLSHRSGKVGAVTAKQVWDDEWRSRNFTFEYGTDRHLRYIPLGNPHRDDEEAQRKGNDETPMWVFAHAQLREGLGDAFEVMPWNDVVSIRDATPAFRHARNSLAQATEKGWRIPRTWTDAPWVKWRGRMACKTVFRQLSGWIPRSVEMAAVFAFDASQERNTIDIGPIIEGTSWKADAEDGPDYTSAGIDASGESGDPGATFGVRDQGQGQGQPQGAGQGQGAAGQAPQQGKPADKTPPPTQGGPPAGQFDDSGATSGNPQGSGGAAADNDDDRSDVEYEGYLNDEVGEPVRDEPWTTARSFVEAAHQYWQKSGNREAFVENNRDSFAEALGIDPSVAALLGEMERQDQGDDIAVIPGPSGRDGNTEYLKAYREGIKGTTEATFLPWLTAQMANAKLCTHATRRQIVGAVTRQAATLKVAEPDVSWLLDPPSQEAQAGLGLAAEGDKLSDEADKMIAAMRQIKVSQALKDYSNAPTNVDAFGRWRKAGRMELITRVQDAYKAQEAEIAKGATT